MKASVRVALLAGFAMWAAPLVAAEIAQPNDNRAPAGKTHRGELRLALEAREARWYPETEEGTGFDIQAFAEAGRETQVPGPLIRVSEGTRIVASIHNRLPVKIALHGFHARPGDARDVVDIPAGETRAFDFEAGSPGTYYYWGVTMPGSRFSGRPVYKDAALSGALIIDPRGARPDKRERIFMLSAMRKDVTLDDAKLPNPGAGQVRTYAINGLAWPFSERLGYRIGEEVRWRWINPTYEPHPLHMHGFYFDVTSVGDGERDAPFAPTMRPHVFTQRVDTGGTIALRWTPDREGNWLFHCHMLDHIGPHLRLRPPLDASHDHAHMDHVKDGMTGLVLGLTVKPRRSGVTAQSGRFRELKLFVQEQPGRFDDKSAFGYALQEGDAPPPPDRVDIPGPLLVMNVGQPTRVAITNRTHLATSVHWHGMELESYFDGVPGFGGDRRRTTPAIRPGEMFVAEMTPPRAGTFMYHTHWHDAVQLSSGMYGPLIVLPPGERYDPTTERMVLISARPLAPGVIDPILINGSATPAPLQMLVGITYRIRFINVTPSAVNYFVRLASGDQPVEWRNIAKDGADLPPQQIVNTKDALSVAVGETRDFEFRPTTPGDLRVEIRLPNNGNLRSSVGVEVR